MKKPLFFRSIIIYFLILFILLLFLTPVIQKSIAVFIFLFLFLSIIFFVIVFHSFSKTLHEIEDSLKKSGSGRFDTRIYLKPGNELEFLAQSFNQLGQALEEKFIRLAGKMEDVENIISSLEEGFLMVDEKDTIVISNDRFKKIINNSAVENKKYWEVLRDVFFDDLIKNIRFGKETKDGEIHIGEKIFTCKGIFLSSSRTVAIIFYDVTERKNFEKIKRDLVANVSHELKTPLTAIKGYVETMEEEVGEEQKKFIQIIKKHLERLTNIVNDLLVLSEIESAEGVKEKEAVDVKNLIMGIIPIFEKTINEKHLFFRVQAEEDLTPVMVDRFKIEQVFINLIDNAIKYTDTGGITISLHKEKRNLIVTVEDTGIGISMEHLERIFERFYVVDRARSRKYGGTGLGLSIVKHVILLHNGDVQVESQTGRGTKFTIILPA
ncbi:MAG: ATP-binding protein [Candidatus Omnitrophica bacterium]|nr:ATP-binding protein [Candidatus Omnitrophota bacterium]